MKIINLLLLTILISFFFFSCSSKTPFEKAGVTENVYYKFSNSKLDKSLYVKLLPTNPEGKNQLIHKTIKNSVKFVPFEKDDEGVYFQKYYFVSDDGTVSFRVYEKGSFRKKVKNHPYFTSGSGEGKNKSSFRYTLKFSRAQVVQ